MADDLDDEQLGEEQKEEEAVPERVKKIFINHVDTFHGKHIARIFARAKPGSTNDSVEEESLEEENSENKKKRLFDLTPAEDGWKVFGTIQDNQNYVRAPFIHEIIQYKDRNQLIEYLKEMDVIIYDISQDPEQIDEAVWACQRLESIVNELDHQIKFILLSTIMTWTKTQPSEDEVPFSDEDYRRRRAHPNFKEHQSAEKEILKLGLRNKKRLLTFVVAAGLTFGMEESIFHYMFKASWHNSAEVQVFGKGGNIVPTIHIVDLAAVLQNLADRQLKVRYVIGCDTSKDSLMRLTKKVSQALGTGKIKIVDQEEAMLNRDITQADYDMLLASLQFEPVVVREQMNIRWHCENGLIENVQKVIEEYRILRNLTPIKICVLGPPASGKTTISRQLAEKYQLPHIHIKDVIENIKADLEPLIKPPNEPDPNVGEEGVEEEEMEDSLTERIEEARNFLEKFDELRREDKEARLSDEMMTQMLKLKLMSSPCQNQGYVLDGYPKTFDQAVSLFGATGDEEEEEESEDKKPPVNERIIPGLVVLLEASDDYLSQRVKNLPERSVFGTHNTEVEFQRRIQVYRNLGDDGQAEKFFEDVDRPGEIFKIDEDQSIDHRAIVDRIIEKVKEPHNYGPSAEQQEILKRKEIIFKEKTLREQTEEQHRQEKEQADDRMKKQIEWTQKLQQIKHEEYQMLEAQTTPLRNYLMSYVMPTLTQALIECCQTRPEDPVDFVAEYLFKNSS